jgi:hypothetical protein
MVLRVSQPFYTMGILEQVGFSISVTEKERDCYAGYIDLIRSEAASGYRR